MCSPAVSTAFVTTACSQTPSGEQTSPRRVPCSICRRLNRSATKQTRPAHPHSYAAAVAPPCASSRSSCAASRSGHHHEVLLAVVSLRALFACVGFWASSAESGLLLIDAKTADFVAPDKCPCDDMRWHRHPFPPHRRPGTPHDDFLSVTGELQNPIGRTLSGPPSSIPRFPPSRFIQRLPTGALPSSTLIS